MKSKVLLILLMTLMTWWMIPKKIQQPSVDEKTMDDLGRDFKIQPIDSVLANFKSDPFKKIPFRSAPIQVKKKAVVVKKAEPAKPPIIVKTIFWGGSPVAILSLNGQDQMVKKGKSAFGYQIVEIQKNGVKIEKDTKEFFLSK